jgi:hypothetical protein
MKHKCLPEAEVECGIRYLSKCLSERFKKEVFILVDEYDVHVNEKDEDAE